MRAIPEVARRTAGGGRLHQRRWAECSAPGTSGSTGRSLRLRPQGLGDDGGGRRGSPVGDSLPWPAHVRRERSDRQAAESGGGGTDRPCRDDRPRQARGGNPEARQPRRRRPALAGAGRGSRMRKAAEGRPDVNPLSRTTRRGGMAPRHRACPMNQSARGRRASPRSPKSTVPGRPGGDSSSAGCANYELRRYPPGTGLPATGARGAEDARRRSASCPTPHGVAGATGFEPAISCVTGRCVEPGYTTPPHSAALPPPAMLRPHATPVKATRRSAANYTG